MSFLKIVSFDLDVNSDFPEFDSDVASFHGIKKEHYEVLSEYYEDNYSSFFSEKYSLALFVKYRIPSDLYEEKDIYGDFIFVELSFEDISILLYLSSNIDDEKSWKDFIDLNLEDGEHYISLCKNIVISNLKAKTDGKIGKTTSTVEVIGGVKRQEDLRSHYYRDPLSKEIKQLVETDRWYKYWNNKYGFLEMWKNDEQLKEKELKMRHYMPYFYSRKGKFILFTYDIDELLEDIPRFICMRISNGAIPEYLKE